MARLGLGPVNTGNHGKLGCHLAQGAEQCFAHERERGALKAQRGATDMQMNHITVGAVFDGADAAAGQEPGGMRFVHE